MTDAQKMAEAAGAVLEAIEKLPVLQGLNGPTMAAVLHTAAEAIDNSTTAQAQIKSLSLLFATLARVDET